jgi:hypothetical protein
VFKLPAFSVHRSAWARDARPVLERLAFAVYLFTFVGACGLIGLGLIFALMLEEVRPLCVGLAGGAFARLLQQHGYRVWHFARWEDSFEPSDAQADFGRDPVRSARLRELESVLRELEDGTTGDREVWEVQALRHRANALLAREPELRDVCASQLARHPELG